MAVPSLVGWLPVRHHTSGTEMAPDQSGHGAAMDPRPPNQVGTVSREHDVGAQQRSGPSWLLRRVAEWIRYMECLGIIDARPRSGGLTSTTPNDPMSCRSHGVSKDRTSEEKPVSLSAIPEGCRKIKGSCRSSQARLYKWCTLA